MIGSKGCPRRDPRSVVLLPLGCQISLSLFNLLFEPIRFAVLLLEQIRRNAFPEFARFVGQLFTEWSDRFGHYGEERKVQKEMRTLNEHGLILGRSYVQPRRKEMQTLASGFFQRISFLHEPSKVARIRSLGTCLTLVHASSSADSGLNWKTTPSTRNLGAPIQG